MSYHIISTTEQLPKSAKLLLEDALTEEEKGYLVFSEDLHGQLYCLINLDSSPVLKQRMQTIKNCYLPDRDITIYYISHELLHIFRDQIELDSDQHQQYDTDLDKRFNQILLDAIKSGASDIHFEIGESKTDIRFRIHGMLHTTGQLDTRGAYRLVNYIYNVAAEEGSKDTQFNIDEMQHALLDRTVEIDDKRKRYKIRLQTAPCYPSSLTIVMRLLPIDNQLDLNLQDLGYSEAHVKLLQKAQMRPSGVTIISGTTGSGKSTTLATLLAEIYQRSQGTKKILTTEDPPEYTIPGANQVNLSVKVNEERDNEDLFAKAIRVAMRCDPDVIMVGEVRDQRSSDLLSSAVVSGHQVFTTVHAASALAVFDRLTQLGFDKNILTSPGFISLLIFQTLCPVLCPHCKISHDAMKKDSEILEISERVRKVTNGSESLPIYFNNNQGCHNCRKGYIGRTVFAEMVDPDPILLQYFRANEYEKALQHWRDNGGVTALEHGIEKMLAGDIDPRSLEDRCGLMI